MTKRAATDDLKHHALRFPEAEEGISCNKSSFKARKKAYCYLGLKDDSFNLMVKVSPSLEEAKRLEAAQPDCFSVGSAGWVKAEFTADQTPPIELLKKWIEESCRLLVHKQLVTALDEQGLSTLKASAAGKKPSNKRKVKKSVARKSAKKKVANPVAAKKAAKKKTKKK